MRYNRFFGDFDFTGKTIKSSDKELINQLANVLRLKAGAEVILCDGKNNEALCLIGSLNKSQVIFEVIKIEISTKEFTADIILYCSILKKENFEFIIQKAVELGVKEIVPIITKRTVKLGLKEDRIGKIIKESAEQSGRGILPVLGQEMAMEEAVESARSNEINIFFELGRKSFIRSGLNIAQSKKIGIFIGPEGGWDPDEIKLAETNKFQLIGLSPFTLRAETAVVAGLAVVIQQFQ